MKNERYPRLLVLSNNSFSKSNSNGRTLGSLLQGWPKDRIAQFCISSDGADFDVCENYYCVTDADVLHATLRMHQVKGRQLQPNLHLDSNNSPEGIAKHRKTSLNMLARNIAWILGFWKGSDFRNWVSDFNPDLILLQSGDSFFMHDLAIKLSKTTNAKLAVFNTEGYYFFKNDYFKKDRAFGKIIFKMYSYIYRRYFLRFMSKCCKQIYGNKKLLEDYINEFKGDGIVAYTSSDIAFEPKEVSDKPVFSYLGTLGFDRPLALIDFANTINEIDSSFGLDVYGYAKDEKMKHTLESCKNIRFHGVVSYSRVKEIISESDFLIHIESQDKKWAESLKYGFSTKIADSISSGKTLILFSSPDIACAKYIVETGAGIFASSKDDLKNKIINYINSEETRNKIQTSAKCTATLNHNFQRNVQIVRDYLCSD